MENDPVNHLTKRDIERFWSYVDKGPDCWNWLGSTYVNKKLGGYGQINVRGIVFRCHRLSYSLVHGEIPRWSWVLHKCDNQKCVNPDHLFLGNATSNNKDMRSKGRGYDIPAMRGESSPAHKLKNRDILKIRRTYKRGIGAVLARKYDVSKALISKIVHRKVWKHI